MLNNDKLFRIHPHLIFFAFLTFSFLMKGQNQRGYIVQVGETAPNFIIKNNGEELFNLQENLGKVIMLQFTASWCSVCIKEMPFIEKEIWQKHKKNDDFVLIALAKDTEKRIQATEEINLMIEKTGVTYPILRDEKSKAFNLFAEEKAGVTRNIIIDKNGEIAFLTRLFDPSEFDEMKVAIETLLKTK